LKGSKIRAKILLKVQVHHATQILVINSSSIFQSYLCNNGSMQSSTILKNNQGKSQQRPSIKSTIFEQLKI
jgi:hypothetical protein